MASLHALAFSFSESAVRSVCVGGVSEVTGPKPCSEGDNFRNKQHALPLGCSLGGTDLRLFCSVFLSITRIGQQYECTN